MITASKGRAHNELSHHGSAIHSNHRRCGKREKMVIAAKED
jgi:hypothetical protein